MTNNADLIAQVADLVRDSNNVLADALDREAQKASAPPEPAYGSVVRFRRFGDVFVRTVLKNKSGNWQMAGDEDPYEWHQIVATYGEHDVLYEAPELEERP